MSEPIVIALLTMIGAIVGPVIVALIQSYTKLQTARNGSERNQGETTPGAKLSLGITLILVAIIGGTVVFLLSKSLANSNPNMALSCDPYGIQIVSPASGNVVIQNMQVVGVYQAIPKNSSIWTFAVYQGNNITYYSPKSKVVFDGKNKTWYSNINYLGPIGDTEIAVFLIGNDSQTLVDYHLKVGNETNNWIPLTALSSDAIKCDSVNVTIH